jgi:hypothetical protein
MVDEIGRHVARMGGRRKIMYVIGGKARRKETSRRIKMLMSG